MPAVQVEKMRAGVELNSKQKEMEVVVEQLPRVALEQMLLSFPLPK
jgi:hypothetical protein